MTDTFSLLLLVMIRFLLMLPLVSVTLLGASVSANLSNVVTPEGSELPDPSVGHEFKATYAANFVHDLQQLMLDGYSSHCCCYGRGDVLALTQISDYKCPAPRPTGVQDFCRRFAEIW